MGFNGIPGMESPSVRYGLRSCGQRTNFGLAYRECLTKRASACRLVAIHVACPKTAGLRLSQEFKAEPAEWADQEQSNMNVLF